MLQINWDSFQVYNQDADSVNIKFENLCRQLFCNENLSGNKKFRYLHANPNNVGLEAEPIYDEVNQRWIGFQAKYFEDRVSYRQIEHSVQKCVENFTGKLNHVFLYCNKSLNTSSLVKAVEMLRRDNISIEIVSNEVILDLVRNKYPYLAFYYFGNHNLDKEWFEKHTNLMLDLLGDRYNSNFNVETNSSRELSLFLHDSIAVDYLNQKKIVLIDAIVKIYCNNDNDLHYLDSLKQEVEKLSDVTSATICDSLKWFGEVSFALKPYVDKYNEEINTLHAKKNQIVAEPLDEIHLEQNHNEVHWQSQEIAIRIRFINELLELPHFLEISDREKKMISSDVLNVCGRAGTGKSQLLANKTKLLLEDDRMALLLLAGNYFSDIPIQEQIMSNLRLAYSFEDFIDVLEVIGEKDNHIVPICIDAINETWNNRLWKSALPLIIEKVSQSPMVKLVFSYRSEYEHLLLTESIIKDIGKEKVVSIDHRGFTGNTGEAIKEFLDYYNIPFTPLEYFGFELSNPLFLTLYCKTYNGEDVSLPILYERLIEKVNVNLISVLQLHTKGFCENDDILRPLITQMVECMISEGRRFITKDTLIKLSYWSEYGFPPAQFINQLVKEELLHNYVADDSECYYFAYDQMNDYYCAKVIINQYNSKAEIGEYLSTSVLGVENGEVKKPSGIDLFVNVCALYAEKYDEECIDFIDSLKKHNQLEIFSRYISSLQWRTVTVEKERFLEYIQKYPCNREDLWSMLIGNSIKVNNPLNSDFLHFLLSSYDLNQRDYLWTIYINDIPSDDGGRLVQLIQMYNRGEKLEIINEKQIELLLILFGWLLTSSNRWLRDYTSKAMIEILKDHFQLCQLILEKFNNVNDPYVIQRLYGVVFGACCKRTKGNLKQLSEYVYETVFNQEMVYPDILLRDYARLIIELFLHEHPSYEEVIDRQKIVPPYKSEAIPVIEDQHYEIGKYVGAEFQLVMSMRIEKMGGYGDFGRYVFESAINNFDVDSKEMFNYALYYIFNNLGFKEKLFGDHDRKCRTYNRHTTVKKERIGKKYQWITMYYMLACISDNNKMIRWWNYPKNEEIFYEGPWFPYVRDFDPSLNTNFMYCCEVPTFKSLGIHKHESIDENNSINIYDESELVTWLASTGTFLDELKNTLILADDNGQQWVCLTKYCDTGRKVLNKEKLFVWSWLYAYFMTSEQAEAFIKAAENGISIMNQVTSSHHETYTVYNREYPWAPNCKDFNDMAWIDVKLRTGEFETVTEKIPCISDFFTEIADGNKYFPILDVQYEEVTREKEHEREIGHILHATTDLLWEEEYDATKENAVRLRMPCAEIINMMGLKQLTFDGYLFDSERKLAAFDTNVMQGISSVVVRKDIIDSFLRKTGLQLIWLVDAEKEIHERDYSVKKWSDWEAVYIYNGNTVDGEIHKMSVNDKL